MAYDRFLIAPIDAGGGGLQTDLRPWLIPDNAFAELVNAYSFRGRIRKRFGTELMTASDGFTEGFEQLPSRVALEVGVTAGGSLAGNVPGVIFKIGQSFSVTFGATTIMFTVYNLAAGAQQMYRTDGSLAPATYDTATGAFNITGTGAPNGTPVLFYPGEPIMGLITYQIGAINDEPVYAFDTQFAYQFTNLGWRRLGTAVWTGSNSQFFWGANYRGPSSSQTFLFVTNYNEPDLMKYWDGSIWNNFNPIFSTTPGNTIQTCRMIIPFHDRLLLIGTIENDSVLGNNLSFPNRIRFSQVGDPIATNAFIDDSNSASWLGGNYIDNYQTQEEIISAEFVKDRLILFFERSTYELAYTGNYQQPFRFQQLNTELGAESTFSTVPFDKQILTVGNVGVHACNGSNVERIDNKIPQAVFDIHNKNDGVSRVYGIRDYFVEQVYWTFPSDSQDSENATTYPNRVLVYNYKTGAWAFNADTFTAFGYFQQQSDVTWGTTTEEWQEMGMTWGQGNLQAQFRQVIAGNQEGYVLIVNPDVYRNAPALQITDLTYVGNVVTLTIVDHNLSLYETSEESPQHIMLENIVGTLGLTTLNNKIYKIQTVPTDDTITIEVDPGLTGVYRGGGTVGRVSNLNITSKQWNPYDKEGKNVFVAKIEFLVDRTENGQVTVDYFPSASEYSMLQNSNASTLMGNNVLETSPYALVPFEAQQDRLWHPVYFQTDGECIQIRISMSEDQITDPDIVDSDFELHALLLNTQKVGRLQ